MSYFNMLHIFLVGLEICAFLCRLWKIDRVYDMYNKALSLLLHFYNLQCF